MAEAASDIKKLISDLTCDDVIKCQNARRRLVELGEGAVESLQEALHHRNHWVHWEAAKALSQIASPSATSALIEILEHGEFEQRWLAADGLVSIGPSALRPMLLELMKKPKSVWLQQGAHHVLLDVRPGDLYAIVNPVIKAIEGPSPSMDVPVAARKAIDLLMARERT